MMLEGFVTRPSGDEKSRFLDFARRMLKWMRRGAGDGKAVI